MNDISGIKWSEIAAALDTNGFAHVPSLLSDEETDLIRGLYRNEKLFRATINMQRYRFGLGEYKYFRYPLPGLIQSLRKKLYSPLVPIANAWMDRLDMAIHFPETLEGFLGECHAKNQKRPTPLILRYEAGGYNTLHQDVYGEIFFPFQVVVMLTQTRTDYEGGELVFVEQLPRAQSRATVIDPCMGDAVIFTTNFRPVKGARGFYRAKMKHGVSPVRTGIRYSMGLIFHDAS